MLISSLMFIFMQHMIMINEDFKVSTSNRHMVSYLRSKNDLDIQTKKRLLPKKSIVKPKLKEKKYIKVAASSDMYQKVKVKSLNISTHVDISSISSLNSIKMAINVGPIDANTLEVSKRVSPFYPHRAKLKSQEGYVKLLFTISQEGDISNIKVLESKPKSVFDKASIRALKKWKFKSNKEKREASIIFNFRLVK